jgi:ketosteroid isomerase-like protein
MTATAAHIADFNARWLKAWSDKDVERLLSFYAPDTLYKDPNTADGIRGHDALRAYLTELFAGTPPMTYRPHEVWPTHDGYCGRWYCTIDGPDGQSYMRGFDLVVMAGDVIALNEVYVHPVSALPADAQR